ncbi:type III pantothenate kinase [Halobacteriovorax sp. GB3]|uniref:type III pantothenate kinase n=1 Tax=Halobacteriovorax sp. GB3 TaxID=2719615 RepID=UPI002361CEFA|nr:type III pantothenate kinase [Halobacteriovorax sp. GB3]MDD0854074.1 type III pantothenate kinase [Halobacteriovorax sp. GB3]
MNVATVDHGNTNPHVGLFSNDQLTKVISLNEFLELDHHHFKKVISSVGKRELIQRIDGIYINQFFKEKHFLSMPVHYSETLGQDRLACSYYAFKKYSNQRVLILDIGTFFTADLVTENGLEGGYIFPGLRLSNDLYKNGAQLSSVDNLNEITSSSLAHTTSDAIKNALHLQFEAIVKELETRVNPDLILITGGQSHFLEKFTRAKTLADKELIHHALYEIFKSL